MKNLSVRVKMILLALITLVGTLAIVLLAEKHISEMAKDSEMVLRASIESDYDENIKNQVDIAISLLNEVYEGYERGEYSLEDVYKRQCLCSVIWNWSAYYTAAVQSVIDGTWDGSNYYGGMSENLVGITELADFLSLIHICHVLEESI